MSTEKKLIVVLDRAPLELIRASRKDYELLNPERHQALIKKKNRDIGMVRPDIIHQCLMILLDSPLNRSGHLKVYIQTEKGVLIDVNPKIRIPRTYSRFCGLISQLLRDTCVKAEKEKLMKLIKNPVTQYFPSICTKVAFSYHSSELVKPQQLPTLMKEGDSSFVVVIGAMAHGSISPNFTEKSVSISKYPLSAALACSKLCNVFEENWNIEDYEV